MYHVTEDTERLIVRHLDGELTQDEELVLSRELLRNPAARRMMDDYQGVDRLASAALSQTCLGTTDPRAITFESKPVRPAVRFHPHRGWLLVPGAIAAALLALAIPRWDSLTAPPSPKFTESAPRTPQLLPVPAAQPNDLHRTVGLRPKIQRDTGREVIGVQGDDGNFYWIEIDRTWTVRQPVQPLRSGEDGQNLF